MNIKNKENKDGGTMNNQEKSTSHFQTRSRADLYKATNYSAVYKPLFRKQGNLLTVSGFLPYESLFSCTERPASLKLSKDDGCRYLIRFAELPDHKTNVEFFYNASLSLDESLVRQNAHAPYFPAPRGYRLMPKHAVKRLMTFLEKNSSKQHLAFFKAIRQIIQKEEKETLYVSKYYLPHIICETRLMKSKMNERQ